MTVLQYGNMGCQVSKGGTLNWVDRFLAKYQHKDSNVDPQDVEGGGGGDADHTGLISSDSFQVTTLTACITLKIQPL